MSKQNGSITADLRGTNVGGKCFSKVLRVCSCRVRTFTSCHVLMHHVLYTPPKKWRRHGSKLFSLSFIFKTQCLIDASNNVSLLSSSRFIYIFIFSQNSLLRLASFNRFCTGSVNVKEHSGQKYLTIRPVALSGYGAIAMRLLIHGH